MKMHFYPSYMVPYVGLNKKIDVNALMEYGDFAIARRIDRPYSDKDIKKMQDGSCIVRLDSDLHDIFFEHIPKLSMTMLRHEHSIETAKYKLEKPGSEDWKGLIVQPNRYRGNATMMNDSYLMVYRAKNLHGQPVEYQRRFDSRKAAEKVQDDNDKVKEDLIKNQFKTTTFYKEIGKIFLHHLPTMLNYWHYELKLMNSEGKEITNVKLVSSSTQLNMKPSFVEYVWSHYLNKFFWINENPCDEDIPEKSFYDQEYSCVIRWVARTFNKCLFALIPIAN